MLGGAFRLTGKDEHMDDVRNVLTALLDAFGVGAKVVVALGKAETT